MTEHSPPCLCPKCGYNVDPPDGAKVFTCPECGNMFSLAELLSRERELGVAGVVRVGAWVVLPIAGLWILAMGAGLMVSSSRFAAYRYVAVIFAGLAMVHLGARLATEMRRLPEREPDDRERLRHLLLTLLVLGPLTIGVLAWWAWEWGLHCTSVYWA